MTTSTTAPAAATPAPTHAAYFAFRDRLLGELRTTPLGDAELRDAGRLIYGAPENLSLYGIPAPRMAAAGIRLLGRTTIECCIDAYTAPVADALAEIQAAHHTGEPEPPGGEPPFVADLFCGSGNFGHHLGRRLGFPVHASELDPDVHDATRRNLDLIGSDIRLSQLDYRDLLGKLPPRSPRDTYAVEPPWGPAFTPAGLDLTRTSPPVPEVLGHIRASRAGMPCYVAVKTNDQLAHDSLDRSFAGSVHLRTVTPPPTLPRGANMDFHLYRLD
ncbi:hypothetical protein ABZ891_00560 [Streptomyces sp. NPDC047023]|uniref:class I SAM-dependent methyltransferase n=1 Tax=Streptomyces sp. NPDC047023 TaxID=3155139 RepID=UPI00340C1236